MDNNEPITEHGLFWLGDDERRKLWGTLHINEAKESKLETFGSLIDRSEEGPHTIVGRVRTGQVPVTLIDCLHTNTQMSLGDGQTDWSRQTCVVNAVLEGIGFGKGEEIAFGRAFVGIATLPKWANPNIVKLDYVQGERGPSQVTISIEDRADESTRVCFGGEEVEVSLRFLPKQDSMRRGVITRVIVEDDCWLVIERSDGTKMPLETIASVAKAIQDLLSICCNETPTITSFIVHHEKGDRHPVKVHVRMWGSDVKKKEGRAFPALSLDALGGIGGIGQWIREWERYGTTVALLTSNWYNEKAYHEDSFSRMYTAVEGLWARKKNRSKANIEAVQLERFVEEAIPGFESIADRPLGEWVNEVRGIRNQRISHSDPFPTVSADGRTLIVMTNLLYIVGSSFLLREIGVGDNRIDEYIRECNRSLLLS